jgi:hypothetical protein
MCAASVDQKSRAENGRVESFVVISAHAQKKNEHRPLQQKVY